MEVRSSSSLELYVGPFEVVFDIPYDAGCYEILTSLTETPIIGGDTVTPAWCITECLKMDPAKRFACKFDYITLKFVSKIVFQSVCNYYFFF